MCITTKKLHKDDGRCASYLTTIEEGYGNTQHHGACNSWKPRGEIVKLSVSPRA